MIELSTKEPSTEGIAREPLFSVDGTEYTVPVTVPAIAGLEIAQRLLDSGEAAAQLYALRVCLGPDGFAALRGAKDISSTDLATIISVCVAKCVGSGPKASA